MNDWLSFFYSIIPDFLKGLWISLQMTIVGLGIGFLLGLPSALGRVYGGKLARWVSIGYIELFRGTPLLVQLFIIYFGLPGLGLTFDRMTCAFIALGLNSGAYQAEFLRGAFQAINRQRPVNGWPGVRDEPPANNFLHHAAPGSAPGSPGLVQRTHLFAQILRCSLPDRRSGSDDQSQNYIR